MTPTGTHSPEITIPAIASPRPDCLPPLVLTSAMIPKITPPHTGRAGDAEHDDPLAALDYFTVTIRNYQDAGDTTTDCHDLPEINTAIAHLRDVLGDRTYESLAQKGDTMTTAEMVAYAYDQIDQARTKLEAVSKQTGYESLKTFVSA